MVTLLQSCSLEHLELNRCVISKGAFATDDFAVHAVAQCFARNKTLLGLSVDFASEHVTYHAAIIPAMQENTCLQRLTIGVLALRIGLAIPFAIEVTDALASLLESSICPLRELRLNNMLWRNESFARIAQGIQTSMNIRELYISRCCFYGASRHQFCSIFTFAGCTTSKLTLSRNVVFRSLTDGNSMLLDLVTSPHSGLRELCMEDFSHSATENVHYQDVLRGLATASCRIRVLVLDKTISDSQFDALLIALPNFQHLGSISFAMKSAHYWKAKVLSAFRHNCSLRESSLLLDGHYHWSTEERSLLQAYCQRNRSVESALQSESLARGRDVALLPSLLYVSMHRNRTIGVSLVFRVLHQVDDQVGPISRSTKRTGPMDNSGQYGEATIRCTSVENMQRPSS
jgi:hypothetical protein